MNGYPQEFNIEADPQGGAQYRRDVRLGFRADIEGSGGLQDDPRAVTQSARGKHDEILNFKPQGLEREFCTSRGGQSRS